MILILFTDWCQSVGENPNFEGLDSGELVLLLRCFYAEAKKQDETVYSLQSLRGTRAAIHHHLTSLPHSCTINILHDKEFLSANVFKAVMKRMKRERNDQSQHKNSSRAGDVQNIFSSGVLSSSNQTSLLRMVRFYSEVFCRRGRA